MQMRPSGVCAQVKRFGCSSTRGCATKCKGRWKEGRRDSHLFARGVGHQRPARRARVAVPVVDDGGHVICEAREWNAHQRAVQVKEWLDNGERLTMAEIARRTGLTKMGARYMMAAISAIQPYTEIDGLWQRAKSDFTVS